VIVERAALKSTPHGTSRTDELAGFAQDKLHPAASFGGLDVDDVSGGQHDSYELVMENTGTVQRWAREEGVIVGRNGAFILSDRPMPLHVKLDGPLPQRIERAPREAGIKPDRAARLQKNEDRIRADMSRELYAWRVAGGSFPLPLSQNRT
jgi:hypothetical protein